MTTPVGQISLDDVNIELGIAPGTQINMNAAPVRGLAGVPTGQIAMSNLQGKSNAQYVAATGGTITTSGDYKIHEFTGSGTFTVTDAGNDAGSNSVEYLVLAGGAGGGIQPASGRGGGGAGGQLSNFPSPATGGIPVSVTSYPVTVGAGGGDGGQGNPSVFSTVTTDGGGRGGGGYAPCIPGGPPPSNGFAGGSGGGAGRGGTGAGGNSPPRSSPAIPAQGTGGGNAPLGDGNAGAGGGGTQNAGSPSGTPGIGGPGGNGIAISITGSPVTRGGGGGGSSRTGVPGAGGAGGGGPGASGPPNRNGTPGTPGTGGGGGAGIFCSPSGSGGSGKVIIRYKFQ